MKKFLRHISLIVAIMLSISAFATTASAAGYTSSGMVVMNANFYNGDDVAASNYTFIDRNAAVNEKRNVYQIKVTGTITTSQSGAENYLYVYNVKHDKDAYIALPSSGSFTRYLEADIPLQSGWYFQLVSFRSGTSGMAATTLKNGNVTFYYN